MAHDRKWARSLLYQIGLDELMGQPHRQLADDGSCRLVLDWQPWVREVTVVTI